ncbi:hypothetical protein BZJ17_05220 [Salinivibrio sp. IB574]|uniref:serine protease n=1 Tax=Salinivibrio sp. IB574 TaxID=1909444 RepID=UPI000988DF53|nr:serine protease [Salinivibrio sp. IB574]OOF22920.1 hypothetical protein BZJ17_05220 [Salinivibrio sp. IB574]
MKHTLLSAVSGAILLASSPLMASGMDSELTAKIIGGKESHPDAWPYMAALTRVNKNSPFCGGSLIAERYVLTAAHCLVNEKPQNFDVILNAYDMNDLSASPRAQVRHIYMHPDYQPGHVSAGHDIAILELTKAMNQQSAMLGNETNFNELDSNQFLTAIGFGYRQYKEGRGSDQPTVLHEVQLPFVPMAQCKSAHEGFKTLGDGVFCAGEMNKDTCMGDSGGPLFYDSNDGLRQMGIVSWGYKCGINPGVYTKISHYKEWIEDNTRGLSYRRRNDLGIVPPGDYSHTFSFTNISGEFIELNNPKVKVDGRNGLGSITENTCGDSLAPEQQCQITTNFSLSAYQKGSVMLEIESADFHSGKVFSQLDYHTLQSVDLSVKNYLSTLPEHKAHTNDHPWRVEGQYLRSALNLEKGNVSELVLEDLPRGELSFIYAIDSNTILDNLKIYVNDEQTDTLYIKDLSTIKEAALELKLLEARNIVRMVYTHSKHSDKADSHVKLSNFKHQKLIDDEIDDLIEQIDAEHAKRSNGGGGSVGIELGLFALLFIWRRRFLNAMAPFTKAGK